MSAKNKLYLTIVLMAALLAGGGFAVWFLLGLIAEGSEEIVKLQTEQRMIETQRNRLDDMTRNYESLKDSIPSIDSVLLDPLDKLKFIMLVEELSAKTSVEHVIEAVAAPSASDKEKASGADSIMFNINVAGDFPNVIKFIYSLENSLYYVNIEKVQLGEGSARSSSSAQGPAGAGIVKAQMSVKVYSK